MSPTAEIQSLVCQFFTERKAIAPIAGWSYGATGDRLHLPSFLRMVIRHDQRLAPLIVDALDDLVAQGFLDASGPVYTLTAAGARQL